MRFSYSRYNPQIKLSPKEMLEISQEINQEFAPNFSIKKPEPASQHTLSPKEMFDISEEIRQDFAPKASNNTQELVLMPVDPDHLYIYRSLGDDKLNIAQKNDSDNQLTLKIYSAPNKNTTGTNSWFDLVIDSAQAQQKVFLPQWAHETASYITVDNSYSENSLVPSTHSNITHIPLGKVIPNQFKENQIVFKSMPQLITASLEIATYTHNSASGQGNNQSSQ